MRIPSCATSRFVDRQETFSEPVQPTYSAGSHVRHASSHGSQIPSFSSLLNSWPHAGQWPSTKRAKRSRVIPRSGHGIGPNVQRVKVANVR